MSRMSNTKIQRVSSWTGFNIMLRSDKTVNENTVAYLPTVIAPTTELTTVHEVLNQSLKIMQSLELNVIGFLFSTKPSMLRL